MLPGWINPEGEGGPGFPERMMMTIFMILLIRLMMMIMIRIMMMMERIPVSSWQDSGLGSR